MATGMLRGRLAVNEKDCLLVPRMFDVPYNFQVYTYKHRALYTFHAIDTMQYPGMLMTRLCFGFAYFHDSKRSLQDGLS